MGLVYADIELISRFDLEASKRGFIKAEEVKKVKVNIPDISTLPRNLT